MITLVRIEEGLRAFRAADGEDAFGLMVIGGGWEGDRGGEGEAGTQVAEENS